jgi:hypothetical protein
MNDNPNVPLGVVRWAAQECEWQSSGEASVYWMLTGWVYARRNRNKRIALHHILELGALVEPRHNLYGLRKVGVRVGSSVKLDWQLVPAALDQLIADQDALSPVEWFRQYEEIHCWRDGNGRTGSLLLNWLGGTLLDPVMPPNLWHDWRRDERKW